MRGVHLEREAPEGNLVGGLELVVGLVKQLLPCDVVRICLKLRLLPSLLSLLRTLGFGMLAFLGL